MLITRSHFKRTSRLLACHFGNDICSRIFCDTPFKDMMHDVATAMAFDAWPHQTGVEIGGFVASIRNIEKCRMLMIAGREGFDLAGRHGNGKAFGGENLMTRLQILPGAFLFVLGIYSPVAAAENSNAAAQFAAECAQCHGRAARGMASFPSLLGKSEEHLTERLNSYRERERVGPNSMLMFGPAADLSDEDIAALATYIATEFN